MLLIEWSKVARNHLDRQDHSKQTEDYSAPYFEIGVVIQQTTVIYMDTQSRDSALDHWNLQFAGI